MAYVEKIGSSTNDLRDSRNYADLNTSDPYYNMASTGNIASRNAPSIFQNPRSQTVMQNTKSSYFNGPKKESY